MNDAQGVPPLPPAQPSSAAPSGAPSSAPVVGRVAPPVVEQPELPPPIANPGAELLVVEPRVAAPIVPAREGPVRPKIRWRDLIVSIILLVIAPGVALRSMVVSGFSALGTIGCAPGACDGFGWIVTAAVVLSPLIALAGATITIVMLVKRRRAWPWIASAVVLSGLISVLVVAISVDVAA